MFLHHALGSHLIAHIGTVSFAAEELELRRGGRAIIGDVVGDIAILVAPWRNNLAYNTFHEHLGGQVFACVNQGDCLGYGVCRLLGIGDGLDGDVVGSDLLFVGNGDGLCASGGHVGRGESSLGSNIRC